jgi:peptide/nickel transport system substrate-binding protein
MSPVREGLSAVAGEGTFWDRYTRARISRRRALQAGGIAATGAAAYALAGCSDGGNSSTEDPRPGSTVASGGADRPDLLNSAHPARAGGTHVTANSATFGTFDPHIGIATASAYFPRVYNLLLSQSPTRPEFTYLDLAEAFETPDEQTYVFTIRPGVRVAPNDLGVEERDIDGEDVRATLERIKTDSLTNQYSFASKYVESVTVDGASVTLKLTEPYAWFIPRISSYYNTIPPRELLADLSKINAAGAGGGPYRVVSVSENDRAIFQRNPNYYRRDDATGEQLPFIDELDVRVIFERNTQRTAFVDDQIQQYWPGDGREARSLGDVPIARDPVFSYISFCMNVDRPPFNDPRARRAVSRALNRQQFVDNIYAGDAQPNGLVHWPLGAYALPPDDLAATYQPYDPADARALADALGGLKLPMIYPSETTIWEHDKHFPIFVEQMRAGGIEVEAQPLAFVTWISTFFDRKYDTNLALNQIYETPELPLLMHETNGPFGDGTYLIGLGDAEVDAAVAKANTTPDLDERIEAVLEAQRVIYSKDPACLPLVSPYQYIAYSRRLKNIPTGIGTTQWSLSTMWLDG